MKKICICLCILLVLSLCGCGKPAMPEPSPAPNPPVSEESFPAKTEPITEPAANQEEEENPLPTGFVAESAPAETEPASVETEPAPTETEPLPQEVAPPPVSDSEEGPAAMISTKYYELLLPESWGTDSCYQTRDLRNGGYSVRIYEAQSYWEFGGGELCTLMLVPTSDDSYKSLPSYEMLAALDTPDGSFYVIVTIATNARLSEGAEDTYNALAEGLMDVLYTIQPKDGIAMSMP